MTVPIHRKTRTNDLGIMNYGTALLTKLEPFSQHKLSYMIKLMVHQWQDIALATSTCVFNIALLPSVFGKHKPALGTCLLTSTFLIVNITAYFTLSLWYAAIMASVNLCLWTTLLVQVYLRDQAKSKVSLHKK